jgi:hypothetical protein
MVLNLACLLACDIDLMVHCQRENVHKNFRWTPRTTWVGFCGVLLVPATIWYISYSTDVGQSAWDSYEDF